MDWNHAGGVDYWDPLKPQFHSIQNKQGSLPSLNFINSFVEVNNDVLWIGTDGSGIQQFDKKQMKYVENLELDRINKICGKAVISMIHDKDHNIWIGSYGNGLTKYNLNSKKIEHIEVGARGLMSNYVWTLFESRDGVIWIGCLNGPYLQHFDKTKDCFITDMSTVNGVVSLNETYDGKILIGTFDGIIVYDPVSKKTDNNVFNAPVRAIHVDNETRIWMGTEGGGMKVLNPDNSIRTIDPDMKEIKSTNVMAIREDSRQNLWISTYSGLYCYNRKTGKATYYGKDDGLQSNQFTYSSSVKTSDNWMFFGGINGFSSFNPMLIQPQKQEFKLNLVDIKILNKSVADDGQKFLKPNSITNVEQITLPYNKAYINLEYTAVNFSNPGKIEYAYILDGIEKNWNEVGNKREANYINLPPGKYTFIIKASSNEGILNEQSKTIGITILPPFWKTWWAYLIYLFVVAFATFRYQIFAIKQIHAKKEQELDQLKLGFFINVSHELRTPLTIMLNPLEKIHNSNNIEEIHASSQIVQQSVSKLLNMVNQLLDFRKLDKGKSTLLVRKVNLVELTAQNVKMFEEMAREKQINISFENQMPDLTTWVDPDKFEKIVSNLLSNALKFTNSGGSVIVSVNETSIAESPKALFWRKDAVIKQFAEVRVADTGVGLSPAHIRNIFERFFQVDTTKPGTGIGLNYVKGLIELHGGEIRIESELQKGSAFIVKLPLDDDILKLPHVEVAPDDALQSNSVTIAKEALFYDLRNMDHAILSDDSAFDRTKNQLVLIVEDNKTLRNQISDELANRYLIKEASNGTDGLEKTRRYIPDLIITDVMMPEMDGIEMCKRIKDDLAVCHVPIIMLTAKGELEDRIEGFEQGADEYLSKPFSMELLKVRIQNLILSRDTLRRKYLSSKTFAPAKEFTTNNLDEAFIEKATKIVLENIEDPDFSLNDFYEKLGMSRSVFFQKISTITGQNPITFVRVIRLKHAAEMLLEDNSSVQNVGYMCGFSSSAYFIKSFKDFFGQTPKEYAKKS